MQTAYQNHFPHISYYFHIPKIFDYFYYSLEKIGIDEKVICYHNISNKKKKKLFYSVRKKIEKNFWDMEIIGNRRKRIVSTETIRGNTVV